MKKWHKRMSAAVLCAAMLISSAPSPLVQAGYDNEVQYAADAKNADMAEGHPAVQMNGQTYSTLKEAIDAVANRSTGTIEILEDMELSESILINGNKTIILTVPKEQEHTIKRAENYRGTLFQISEGATLKLGTQEEEGGRLILDGAAAWVKSEKTEQGEETIVPANGPTEEGTFNQGLTADKPLIELSNGSFELQKSAVLQNNDNQSTGGGAIVSTAGGNGNIRIYGQVLDNRSKGNGGGISGNCHVYIYEGALFEGNVSEGNGGAIENYGGGIIHENKGDYRENAAVNGGAVWIDGNTVISGGTYEGNQAKNGGALYIQSNGQSRSASIQGGLFRNNTADQGKDLYQAVEFVYYKGNVQMEDVYLPKNQVMKVNGALGGRIGVSGEKSTQEGEKILTAQGDGYTLTQNDAAKIVASNPYETTVFENAKVYRIYRGVAIEKQPVSIPKVNMGETAELSITAKSDGGGDSLTYQWYRCEDENGTSPQEITGATNAVYTVPTDKEGTFYFYCIVKGATAEGIQSDVVSVTVVDPDKAATPVIQEQPKSYTYDVTESMMPLKVEASAEDGGRLTYQWYESENENLESAVKIEGADQNTYTPETKEGKRYYYVEVTNHGNSVTNKPVTVKSDAACIQVGNYEARIGDAVYATFAEAVEKAAEGEEVKLLKDISPSSGIKAVNKKITVNGQGHTIYRTSAIASVSMLQIDRGNLTIRNLTMDGGAKWGGETDSGLQRGRINSGIESTNPILLVQNAAVNIETDVVLQNNANKNGSYKISAGAIQITGNNSNVQFSGVIKNNASSSWGGAVMQVDNGRFVMNGGEVNGNESQNTGGAFCMDNQSQCTINDGLIQNNVSRSNGGALWISNGKATLNGGEILNNQSTAGNLVYVQGAGTVEFGNVQADNPDSANRPAIQMKGGTTAAFVITGQPQMKDVILFPDGKLLTVKTELKEQYPIYVKPAVTRPEGGKIARGDTEAIAVKAAGALKVEGFSCYAGYESYENPAPDEKKTAVYYGPSVELQITKDLEEEMTVLEGRPFTLHVEAKVEPEKDEYTFPIYHWYSCTDKEGNNAKLLKEGKDETVFKSTDHKEGTRYYFCEVTSSKYGAVPVRSRVITVHAQEYYPASLAIDKFNKVMDYDLKISDIQTSDEKGKSLYFEKEENIKVSFQCTNAAGMKAEKVWINQNQCELTETEENKYETTVTGFGESGVKTLQIEKLVMEDGRVMTVQNNVNTQVEILKEVPAVENFSYTVTEEQDTKILNVSFDLKDPNGAFQKGTLVVSSDDNSGFSKEIPIETAGQNNHQIPLTTDVSYTVQIFADYDLDGNTLTQGDNEFKDREIFTSPVSAVAGMIEFKDVESVEVYRSTNGNVEKVDDIPVAQFHPEEYIAKVKMKELPVLYAEIESGKEKDGEFWLTLKYDYAVHYENGEQKDRAEVKFGDVVDGVAKNMGFERLIETIRQNPKAEVSLTMDLDAANVSVSTATYLENFQGILHGNGYTIRNLQKPLFNRIENGRVENLVIEDANLSNAQGILMNSASETVIANVHMRDVSLQTNKWDKVGGFVGETGANVKIEQCSANNVSVKGNKYIGGFAGKVGEGFSIQNSYVKGTINATRDAVGGMIGQTDGNATIRDSYADVDLQMSASYSSVAGLVGYAARSLCTLENNISLADGTIGKRVIGTGYAANTSNNYEMAESGLSSNANGDKIKEISKSAIDSAFLQNVMQWDPMIWDLEGASGENMPTLKNADPAYGQDDNESTGSEESGLYIPEIERLKKLETYDEAMQVAYHNVNKLIPFYDANYIVEFGNIIPKDSLLNTEKIKHLFVYDKEGKLATGINTNTYQDLSKLMIVYENGQKETYHLTFHKKLEDIAAYTIDELNIGYTYDQFILNLENPIVKEIQQKASEMDYDTISSITPETESRLYRDYYNESVKSNIQEIILKILESEGEYNLYLDNEIINQKMREDMFENGELQKIIYTYNYFDKWYHVSIGDLTLTDIIFYNIRNINFDSDIKNWVVKTLNQSQDTRATKNVVSFYQQVIMPVSGKPVTEFYDYFIEMLTDDSAREWFTKNFKGILVEQPVKNTEVKYRAWDLLKTKTTFLMTILSAPQEKMYLMTAPTQLIIGSINLYGGSPETVKTRMKNYANKIKNFYEISMSWISDSVTRLNNKVQLVYDSRVAFSNGVQEEGKTQDPVIKWVYESMGQMGKSSGSGAYANGTDVHWVTLKCLDNFYAFTHETAHNQDGYYFYEGNGRRAGTGAEDHADGNIAQEFDSESYVFNITNNYDLGRDMVENLQISRIEGKEKLEEYYQRMFETTYVLDYLEGQAFLRLSNVDQAKVGVQATYPDGGDYDIGGGTIEYKEITPIDFDKMNLQSMEDLWDNGICLTETRTIPASNKYGTDTFTSVYWYQPHNDNGRPDSFSFKMLGFEMLGVGGYSDGYVTYRSGKSKNDLDALRKITGDDTITWKKYKMDRYNKVAENLEKIPYFNPEDVIELFEEAMKKDALLSGLQAERTPNTNQIRRVLYGMVKRATKDFQDGSIDSFTDGKTQTISTAEEFMQVMNSNEWGNYELTADLDFTNVETSGAVYIPTKQFLGRIDGKGHTIKGLKKPLFQKLIYAQMKNFKVETSDYEQSADAILAKESRNIVICDIELLNNERNLPFVKTDKGGMVKLGSNKEEINSDIVEIRTVSDLLNISESEANLKKEYILKADLDMMEVTNRNSVVTGNFRGRIDGNGHTIQNLRIPMFETLGGVVENLNFVNVNLDQNTSPNLFASRANDAIVQDIKVDQLRIDVKSSDMLAAGGLVSDSSSSSYSNISIQGLDRQNNGSSQVWFIGGLFGMSGEDTLENILIKGQMEMDEYYNGALIGYTTGGEISKIYADVDMNEKAGVASQISGGLYGYYMGTSLKIKDTLVVGDVPENTYKIAPDTDAGLNSLENVFEYEDSTGKSNAENHSNIKIATAKDLRTKTFYTETLKWSEDVWDFSNVSEGGSPVLK